jgi:hypothetical protein
MVKKKEEKKTTTRGRSKKKLIVEIDELTLKEFLDANDLKLGDQVRLIKGLEIMPGAIIAKQYDR